MTDHRGRRRTWSSSTTRKGAGLRTLSLVGGTLATVQTVGDVLGIGPNALAVGSGSARVLDYDGALTPIEVAWAELRCGILAPTTASV